MPNPYYNRNGIARGSRATSEQINAELEKIEAAFLQLPDPTAIPAGGGAPNYTWVAYADSADGSSNFTTGAGGTRAYIGIAANKTVATESTHPEDYTWKKIAGAAAPETMFEYSVDGATDWHQSYQAGDKFLRSSVNGGSTWGAAAQISVGSLEELDPTAADKLDGIEAGADQTSNNDPRLTIVNPIEIAANYLGVIEDGQLPVTRAPRRFKGNTDVSDTTVWTATPSTGVTATINNTGGDAQRGTVSVTALSVAEGSIVIKSSRDGVDISQTVPVKRKDAAAPAPGSGSGGGGGGTPGTPATTSSFSAVGATGTHTAISAVLSVVVGSSGQVNLAAGLSFSSAWEGAVDTSIDSPTQTFLALKWRYSADGSTGWADVGTEEVGDPALDYFNSSSPKGLVTQAGYTGCAKNKTGLSSGATAYFQLLGRMASGTSISSETGTASATPQ